jgi:hypothetical protein
MSFYYIIRSRVDGKYLVARFSSPQPREYLLIFTEDFLALTYLQHHTPELREQFTVEPVNQSQLKSLIDRWNFTGVGLVNDPLIPHIDFLTSDKLSHNNL